MFTKKRWSVSPCSGPFHPCPPPPSRPPVHGGVPVLTTKRWSVSPCSGLFRLAPPCPWGVPVLTTKMWSVSPCSGPFLLAATCPWGVPMFTRYRVRGQSSSVPTFHDLPSPFPNPELARPLCPARRLSHDVPRNCSLAVGCAFFCVCPGLSEVFFSGSSARDPARPSSGLHLGAPPRNTRAPACQRGGGVPARGTNAASQKHPAPAGAPSTTHHSAGRGERGGGDKEGRGEKGERHSPLLGGRAGMERGGPRPSLAPPQAEGPRPLGPRRTPCRCDPRPVFGPRPRGGAGGVAGREGGQGGRGSGDSTTAPGSCGEN